MIKEYIDPEIDLITLQNEDAIRTSDGTETTPKDENDGSRDIVN